MTERLKYEKQLCVAMVDNNDCFKGFVRGWNKKEIQTKINGLGGIKSFGRIFSFSVSHSRKRLVEYGLWREQE